METACHGGGTALLWGIGAIHAIAPALLNILPTIATVLVSVTCRDRLRKRVNAPAALGLSHAREEKV